MLPFYRRYFRPLTLVLFAALLAIGQVAEACPSCKRALGDGSQGDLARGMYYSILFMLSMPVAIIGTFGTMAYLAVKRERRRLAEEEARKAAESDYSDD